MADFSPYSPPSNNLVDQLTYWSTTRPEDLAFTFVSEGDVGEDAVTYSQLDLKARTIAARLLETASPGDRVLMLYPPGLEFIAALWGCFYSGLVAVPAYPPRRNRNMLRIQAIADDARAQVALTTLEIVSRADKLSEEAPHLKSVRWMATDDHTVVSPLDQPRSVRSSDLAMLQYTSGSTGMPKGVMLTHDNLCHQVKVIADAFPPVTRNVGVSWLPLFHDMGLVGGVLNPLFNGWPSYLMSPMWFLARPIRWLQAMSRYGGNITGGPNFAYQLCVDRISEAECEGLDLSRWEIAVNGAEPIRAETLEAFTEKFAPYGFQATTHYPCYGMAESTLMITGGPRKNSPTVVTVESKPLSRREVIPSDDDSASSRRIVGCGEVLADYEVSIVDPDTNDVLPANRVGEIWVRGASVADGYWYKPDESRETFDARLANSGKGNFLRTGDLGFISEGQLFVTGRLKDLIILRGINYYPQDIERTVEQTDPLLSAGVAAAFSVLVQGSERLVIVAEVERRRGTEPTEIIDAVRSEVTKQHDIAPEAVVLVRLGTVPRTSSGKLQRLACRESFLDGSLRVVSQWRGWKHSSEVQDWSAWQDAYEMAADTLAHDATVVRGVFQCVTNVAGDRAAGITLDTNIVDLGLDSLERMEIVAALEGHFSGRFPSDIMTEVETCREVVEAVDRYLIQPEKSSSAIETARDVPDDSADPRLFPEVVELSKQLEQLHSSNASTADRNPFFQLHEKSIGVSTTVAGKSAINFSTYNYLGLAGDPRVNAAAQAAIEEFGTSASASRLVSGERPFHRELEQAIAQLIGAEAALTFVGGHATNETTIGHLLGPGDLVLYDARAHNSIIQGARLSGARRRPFPHNDWQALDDLLFDLRPGFRRVLVALEGIYSMDGDFPELPQFVEVKKRHQALLLVDEAHSIGTLGPTGRGIREHFKVSPTDVDLWMGTLSKALGSCGGYIAGRQEIIQYLRYTAPGFVYSVGMSPANAAAALASIHILLEQPERVLQLQANSRFFRQAAAEAGLIVDDGVSTPVIPYITHNVAAALQLSEAMLDAGINVRPIVPPAVEENASRLRFFLTCDHTRGHIIQAVNSLSSCLASSQGSQSGDTITNGKATADQVSRESQTKA